jgi:hypothetical protein
MEASQMFWYDRGIAISVQRRALSTSTAVLDGLFVCIVVERTLQTGLIQEEALPV